VTGAPVVRAARGRPLEASAGEHGARGGKTYPRAAPAPPSIMSEMPAKASLRMIFGGATSHILGAAELPVIMAH